MYRDTVFTIIVGPEVYRDTVFIGVVFLCSADARALFSVCCFQMFSPEIHCREVSNAEAIQLKERVNWMASRATSGAAYFCEVRISGVVSHVGTWLPGVANQVGNLELSWCRPGGTWQLVLS